MRSLFLLSTLILGLMVLHCRTEEIQTPQPPGIENISNPDMTKRLIDYWADYSCFTFSDNSEPNIKDQCREACFPGGITSDVPTSEYVQSSQTCWLNGPEADYRTGKPLTDQQKEKTPRESKWCYEK